MIKKTREILKFSQLFFILFLLVGYECFSIDTNKDLSVADSLFINKKYTESFEIYDQLFQKEEVYSPAMLLKMAFIQEGLGNYSNALYYLNIYFNNTLDRKALTKINEIVTEHNLLGHESPSNAYITQLISKFIWAPFAGFAIVLFMVILFSIRRVNRGKGYAPLLVALIFTVIFGISFNLDLLKEKAIVMDDTTYLMDEPSGSANVVETISKGHKLIFQKHDEIWSSVIWEQKNYFVRQSKLKEII